MVQQRQELAEDVAPATAGPAAVLPWRVPARPAGFYRRRGKRWLDVALASALLVALTPVLAAVGVAILLTSGRPLLYGSQRTGRDRSTIRVWKFRTMVRDANRVLREWHNARPDLAREYGERFKLARDPRVTRLGRLLRTTSLDELPQLWNVLRGDMSLVGPRPVPHAELEQQYGPLAAQAFSVAPGMTGLWQVAGRSRTSYAERVRLDCRYAAGGDLLLDLAILARTIPAVLLGRGAE